MSEDPSTGIGMAQTAERIAKENGFTKEQADELTSRRYEQYADALKNERAFQKRYMLPVEVKLSKRETKLLETDEGVAETSLEALKKLKPATEDGILSYGGQTHPADGTVGIIVTAERNAASLSDDSSIPIQVVSYGYARSEKATMPAAPVPAVKMAPDRAGLSIRDVTTIKSHNPFIVNDMYLARQLGIDAMRFNNFGSSLVFGHPQAPTVGRLLIEAIEESVMKGGGYAMAAGCAAGDNGAALIVKVG